MRTAVSPVLAEVRVTHPPSARGDTARRGTAVVEVDADEPVFRGHYPGFPIFPGMCVVECVHRAGLLTAPGEAGPLALSRMESVRFLTPVFPGDQLRVELEWRDDADGWLLVGTAATERGKAAAVRLRYRSAGAR